jgi:hypothetical protein
MLKAQSYLEIMQYYRKFDFPIEDAVLGCLCRAFHIDRSALIKSGMK